jgi:23S rRNA pseudouridine2605 synthase
LTEEGVRLQKYLARAGVASRRACEGMIADGRVRVDGQLITEPGTRVRAGSVVELDGHRVQPAPARWVALHKPPGYVCTRKDPQGRPTVYSLLPESMRQLFHVGRLDLMTEGLLLFTNEGELAHRVLHPRHRTLRRYEVVLHGPSPSDLVHHLLRGVELEDGMAAADTAGLAPGQDAGAPLLTIEIHEGRNREIRRMMDALGVKIRSLKRVTLGPIELGELSLGGWRELSAEEVDALRAIATASGERSAEQENTDGSEAWT